MPPATSQPASAGPEKADTVTLPWPGVCKEGRVFGGEGPYISTMILADE